MRDASERDTKGKGGGDNSEFIKQEEGEVIVLVT